MKYTIGDTCMCLSGEQGCCIYNNVTECISKGSQAGSRCSVVYLGVHLLVLYVCVSNPRAGPTFRVGLVWGGGATHLWKPLLCLENACSSDLCLEKVWQRLLPAGCCVDEQGSVHTLTLPPSVCWLLLLLAPSTCLVIAAGHTWMAMRGSCVRGGVGVGGGGTYCYNGDD